MNRKIHKLIVRLFYADNRFFRISCNIPHFYRSIHIINSFHYTLKVSLKYGLFACKNIIIYIISIFYFYGSYRRLCTIKSCITIYLFIFRIDNFCTLSENPYIVVWRIFLSQTAKKILWKQIR